MKKNNYNSLISNGNETKKLNNIEISKLMTKVSKFTEIFCVARIFESDVSIRVFNI